MVGDLKQRLDSSSPGSQSALVTKRVSWSGREQCCSHPCFFSSLLLLIGMQQCDTPNVQLVALGDRFYHGVLMLRA